MLPQLLLMTMRMMARISYDNCKESGVCKLPQPFTTVTATAVAAVAADAAAHNSNADYEPKMKIIRNVIRLVTSCHPLYIIYCL